MGDQLRHVTDVLRVAGVTVADIADRSGSSLQDVSAELAGRRPMSLHTVEAIRSFAGAGLAGRAFLMIQGAGIREFGVVGHFKNLIPPGLPTWLLPKSSSLNPTALSIARLGACSTPSTTTLE